jgi:hypothetical protein
MSAPEHGRDLDRDVEHCFEVCSPSVDSLTVGRRERACVLHDLYVAAIFEVGKRYLGVVVTHWRRLQNSYAAGMLRAAI